MTPAGALLAAYGRQILAGITAADIASGLADRSGPLIWKIYPGERALAAYCDLAGLTGRGLDNLIAAQRDQFTRLGPYAEWKYHSHDQPADPSSWKPAPGQGGTRPENSADA